MRLTSSSRALGLTPATSRLHRLALCQSTVQCCLNKPRRSLLLRPCYQSTSILKIQEQMLSTGSWTSAQEVHVHAEALIQVRVPFFSLRYLQVPTGKTNTPFAHNLLRVVFNYAHQQMNSVTGKCQIRDTTAWLKMRKGQREQTKTPPKADQRRSDANNVRTNNVRTLPRRLPDRSVKSLGVNQHLKCATTDWLCRRRDGRTHAISREAQLTKDAGEGSPGSQYK